MVFRSCATFLFLLSHFNPSEASADEATKGRDLFLRQCIGCHAFACNKEGPRLGGLLGRKAATAEGYDAYSPSLRNYGIVWTEKTLDNFFSDPGKIVPESVMANNGKIENAVHRQQMIAFLKTEDPTVNICPQ